MPQAPDRKVKTALKLISPLAFVFALALMFAGCNGDSPSGVVINPVDTSGPQLLDITKYSSAEECRGCHPDQVTDWEGSMHAYSAKDPVMAAINLAGQLDYINAVDQGCVKCHSMLGSRAGLTP